MNFDQLRVFLAVARHQHFSRAADELYITQPAVSAAVAKLEAHYGIRLFHRLGRRVEITDVGRFLMAEGQGQYDLGFLTGWPAGGPTLANDGLLRAQEVGQERLLVVVGRGHPWFGLKELRPAQLRESSWVMRERGSGAQSLLEVVLAEVDVPLAALPVALVLTSSEMVKAVVLEGGAAAALPEPMLRQELELGLLWPMPIHGSSRHRQPIWMVQHRQRYQIGRAHV